MDETERTRQLYLFQPLKQRSVEARFDGGRMTSDGGSLLVREVAERTGILKAFARCFTDHRDPNLIEHTVEELVAQRVYGIICGCEDLNDHDQLRHDPIFSVLVGKEEVLASRSTLNRLELARPADAAEQRYKKIVCNFNKVERLLVSAFLDSLPKVITRLIIDLDATDFTLYGHQEGRFFHGFYGDYCYLPLYITCGDHLLAAKLRVSNIDAAAGAVEEIQRIVAQIRGKYSKTKILLRGDAGFARDALMTWCEENDVDYLFGLAKNERLIKEIRGELAQAEQLFVTSGGMPARVFTEFRYRTLDSWSRERRVIAKAEYLEKGSNPRFVVTSLSKRTAQAMELYEKWYCKRGDMENRINEQLQLFAYRMSTNTMRANQIRLWFSSVAYLLLTQLRIRALKGTALARAHVNTIRNKLIKIGAKVTVSVRRVYISYASAFAFQESFSAAYANLRAP